MVNETPPAALVVIDMQEDFFADGVLATIRRILANRTNELVATFRDQNLPVIWVRQEFAPDLTDAFLEMRRRGVSKTIVGTPGAQFLPELLRAERDSVVIKKRYSAFFGTNLDEILAQMEPAALVVAGVNTHACVRTSVIDAYQRDYMVVVADDCVASYDAEHHEITKRYLDGKIARFLSNKQIAEALRNGQLLRAAGSAIV